MKIEVIKVGILECNCYLLGLGNRVLVIDPGDDVDKLIEGIGERELVGIIITHYHFDHIGALEKLIKKYDVKVFDKNNMNEGINNIDEFMFEVIYTPGHKEDAITIYFERDKCMFCGDFIFKDNIGRCDLTGGNFNDMIDSINKIKSYNKDITIYPGHGVKTSLGYEMKNNFYFKFN